MYTVCDASTVPKMLDDTDTDTFFWYQIILIPISVLFSGTKFFRYRFRDFFPIPNLTDTGSDTTRKMNNSRYRHLNGTGTHYKSSKFLNFGNENQFRYQIFPIPVPRLFPGTKFFRYRFRAFFPVPICSVCLSDTTKKMKKSRHREFPVPVRHTLPHTG